MTGGAWFGNAWADVDPRNGTPYCANIRAEEREDGLWLTVGGSQPADPRKPKCCHKVPSSAPGVGRP